MSLRNLFIVLLCLSPPCLAVPLAQDQSEQSNIARSSFPDVASTFSTSSEATDTLTSLTDSSEYLSTSTNTGVSSSYSTSRSNIASVYTNSTISASSASSSVSEVTSYSSLSVFASSTTTVATTTTSSTTPLSTYDSSSYNASQSLSQSNATSTVATSPPGSITSLVSSTSTSLSFISVVSATSESLSSETPVTPTSTSSISNSVLSSRSSISVATSPTTLLSTSIQHYVPSLSMETNSLGSTIYGFPIVSTDLSGSLTTGFTVPVVTSTLTQPPSAFSTLRSTNTLWSVNTVVTTTGSDNNPTVLPVLVGCKACGGAGVGIVLSGLTGLSNTLLKFPGLPSFHLPCIAFCGGGGGGGGGKGSDSEAPVTDEDTNTDDDASSQQSTQSSTSSISQSSTTTSSSSSSSSVSSSSSSTSSAAPTTTRYIVSANTASSQGDRIGFQNELYAEVDANAVIVGGDQTAGIDFWVVSLNDTQVTKFSSNSIIGDISPDSMVSIDGGSSSQSDRRSLVKVNESPKLSASLTRQSSRSTDSDPGDSDGGESNIGSDNDIEPAGSEVKDDDPTEQLGLVSLWRGSTDTLTYVYWPEAGEGITIYILDTGANPASNQYTGLPGSVEWIFVGQNWPTDPTYRVDATRSDSDPSMHGTCVLSKAVGPNYGTAKKSDVVIVKVPLLVDQSTNLPSATRPAAPLSGVLEGYRLIIEHIKANGKQGKAVINDSSGGPPAFMLELYLKELIALDAVVVTASGNDGENEPHVNTYPAKYLSSDIPLIVVGAVDHFGVETAFSQGVGSEVSTHALGESVICARGAGADYTTRSGTSFSSPQVAGVAAYILSLGIEKIAGENYQGKVASIIQQEIIDIAYVRKQLNEDAILPTLWNGWEPPGNMECSGDESGSNAGSDPMSEKKRRKRQGTPSGSASVCLLSSAQSTASSTPPGSSLRPPLTVVAGNNSQTSTMSSGSSVFPASSTLSASNIISTFSTSSTSTASPPVTIPNSSSSISSSSTTTSLAAVSSIDCSNPVNQFPGQCGVSGCAYMLIDAIGSAAAACQTDYCFCGGTVAPLLTATVSGSAIPNCKYTTQPTANSCPPSTATTSSPPAATTTQSTQDTCISCPTEGASNAQAANCPEDHPNWVYDNGICSCCPPLTNNA